MDGIEYIFGIGDGVVETWVTPADLDVGGTGVLDAVALDFDGDGLLDDALWDSDGDGIADTVVIDVNQGDGADWYTDPAGDGTWSGFLEVHTSANPGLAQTGLPTTEQRDPGPAGAESPNPQPSNPQPSAVDPDSTADSPGSAGAPTVVADPAPGILVDTDGDGILDTGLTDSDGDGVLDTASAAGIRLRAGDWWEWGVTQR